MIYGLKSAIFCINFFSCCWFFNLYFSTFNRYNQVKNPIWNLIRFIKYYTNAVEICKMVKKFSLKSKPPKRASSNDKLFADVSIEAFSIFVHPILSAIAFFEEINKLWNNWIIATRLTVSSLTKIAYWFFKLDNRDLFLEKSKDLICILL